MAKVQKVSTKAFKEEAVRLAQTRRSPSGCSHYLRSGICGTRTEHEGGDSSHLYPNHDICWLYLEWILDVYSRAVVGWSMSACCEEELAAKARPLAIGRRRPQGDWCISVFVAGTPP